MTHLIFEWHTEGLPKEHELVIYKTKNGKFEVGRYSKIFTTHFDNIYFHNNKIEGWAYLLENPILEIRE